jgi:oxygen-dependent protoporphyrinogen oxidase
VERIEQQSDGYRITSSGASEDYDHVILATPAYTTAKLLASLPESAKLVELLSETSYTSTITVALAYSATDVRLPEGFGFLVPRTEGRRMMACTFVDRKFEHRAPQGTALLRVFLSAMRNPRILELSDDQVTTIVKDELREILGVASEPRFTRVFRWKNAMPQYEIGHLLRVARIEMHMQRYPGLQLSGSAYHGIGVPDCIRMGRGMADAVMRRARAQRAPAMS